MYHLNGCSSPSDKLNPHERPFTGTLDRHPRSASGRGGCFVFRSAGLISANSCGLRRGGHLRIGCFVLSRWNTADHRQRPRGARCQTRCHDAEAAPRSHSTAVCARSAITSGSAAWSRWSSRSLKLWPSGANQPFWVWIASGCLPCGLSRPCTVWSLPAASDIPARGWWRATSRAPRRSAGCWPSLSSAPPSSSSRRARWCGWPAGTARRRTP